MRLAVKKVRIEDVAKLQTLVAEHIDAIEPGLVVLDSRLLLGQATIDVVGLDVQGALVLIVTGLTANEEMLLKAVEAYSWCLEYPESLERLYPSCVLSEERPPRLLFVVERMPDAFHRKIKQLGFPEVDCVEFRLLDVDGVPTAYFESILKLRRAAPVERAPRVETPATASGSDKVIAFNGAAAARATSLKLQKLLSQAVAEAPVNELRATQRPPAPPREPASVVSMVSRQAAVAAPRPERARPVPEPVVLRQPEPIISVPEPVVVPTPIVLPVPEPVVAAPAAAPVVVHEVEPIVAREAEPGVATPDRALLDQLERALASLDVEPTAAPTVAAAEAAEPEAVVLAEPEAASELDLEVPSVRADGAATTAAAPAPETEPLILRGLPELTVEAPAAPVAVAPAVAEAAERVSFKDLAAALLGAAAPVAPVAPAVASVAPSAPVEREPEPAPAPLAAAPAPPEPSLEELAQLAADELEAAEARTAEQTPEAEEPADLTLTVEALIQSVTPAAAPEPAVEAPAPAAVAPVAPPPAAPAAPKAADKAAALPLEFEGLKFPNDGVLTRQWMEFLGQMTTTKA